LYCYNHQLRLSVYLSVCLSVQARKGSELEHSYRDYVKTFLDAHSSDSVQLGALLIEPLMLGAGGLRFVDPLFQRVLVQECKARKIPVVFDEVRYCSGDHGNDSIVIFCVYVSH
jgi:adenosylmethionine-8-amino-7-oxononanoate aminotransferase